jgi:hypothetical protein
VIHATPRRVLGPRRRRPSGHPRACAGAFVMCGPTSMSHNVWSSQTWSGSPPAPSPAMPPGPPCPASPVTPPEPPLASTRATRSLSLLSRTWGGGAPHDQRPHVHLVHRASLPPLPCTRSRHGRSRGIGFDELCASEHTDFVEVDVKNLPALCARLGIRRLSVFGSVARGEERPRTCRASTNRRS